MTVSKKTKKKKAKKKVAKKATKKPVISIKIKDSPKKKTNKKSKKKSSKKVTKKTPQPHSKWMDCYLEIIKNLFQEGRTIPEVCVAFGISESTYHNWRNNFFTDEVLESIKDWKDEADGKVELSLYRKAKGYIKLTDETIKDGRKYIKVKKAVIIEGDVQAQKYWLNNRKKKDWSEKNESDDSGNNNRDRSFGFNFKDEAEPL